MCVRKRERCQQKRVHERDLGSGKITARLLAEFQQSHGPRQLSVLLLYELFTKGGRQL